MDRLQPDTRAHTNDGGHFLTRRPKGTLIAWSFTAVLLTVAAWNHEPWRDELQAWAIARASRYPWNVIQNVAWERHPPLWHLVLWGPSHVTGAVWGLRLVGLVISLITSWLLIFRAPWNLWVRLALVGGYFFVFELGTVVRSWSLIGLLVVLVLVETDREAPRSWVVSILLISLVFTEVQAVPIALGFAISVLIPRVRERPHRALVIFTSILSGLILFAVVPAPDGGDLRRLKLPFNREFVERVLGVVRGIAITGFPIPHFTTNFWAKSVAASVPLLAGAVVIALFAEITRNAAKEFRTLMFWLVSMVGLSLLVGLFGLPMAVRQVSILFLSMLATLWRIDRERSKRLAINKSVKAFAVLSLTSGLIGGGWAWYTDVREPFTSGEAAADFVRRNSREEVVILCPTYLPVCTTVSVRLSTTFHRSSRDPGRTFFEFSRHRKSRMSSDEVFVEAHQLADRLGVDVAVVETPGASALAPCRNRWEPPEISITNEQVTICMLDDLLPTTNEPIA